MEEVGMGELGMAEVGNVRGPSDGVVCTMGWYDETCYSVPILCVDDETRVAEVARVVGPAAQVEHEVPIDPSNAPEAQVVQDVVGQMLRAVPPPEECLVCQRWG